MTSKTTEQEMPALKIARVFDATPERLWAYWTDPKKYAKWLNPAPGLDLVVQEFDVRPGGRVRFDMPQPDGHKNPQEGVFHTLNPHREIVTGAPDKSFLIRVTFEAVGKQTRMAVEVTGVPPEYHAGATQGWYAGFDKLEAQLERAATETGHRAVGAIVGRSVRVERLIRAPPSKVWAAWSTREMLEKWFWPSGKGKVREFDFRVGGRLVMGHETQPWTGTWEYVEIVPQSRIVIHDLWDDGSGHRATGTIEFTPVPGGTRMVVTHGPFPQAGPYKLEDAVGGFTAVADNLAKLVEAPSARNGFTIERRFQASPQKVWDMWTTKRGLEKWFVPEGYTTKVTKLDLRVGGEYACEMTSAEHTLVNHGTYVDIQPARRLAMVWRFDIFLEPGDPPYDVPITVDFEEVPGGTRMTFTQGPLATAEHTEGSRQGVLSNFDKLATALAE